ncbi:MAG: PEGA domain-containing protein, partial [Longimicrobiales bacterium]
MHYRILLGTILVLSGCATIMHGTKQSVGISSAPAGANIFIDNAPFGATPMVADLARKDHHTIRLEMEGYQPFAMSVSRGVSGWVVGNILFGGLIGLAVDAISGGMYKLTPEQVSATLAQGE